MAQGMTYKDFEARMAAARAAHLKNIDITGKKIQGIYTQAARDLAKRAETTKAGTLTERWVTDYQKALEKRIEQMRGELGGTILSGMRKSAGLPGDTVEGWLNDALAMVGVDGSFTGTFSRTPDAALRMLIDGRMYRDGKSLSRRIWNRTDQLQGSIEDILTQGIAQHRSALQIAQDLEAYVSPKAKMPVSWLTLYPDIPFDRQIDYNAQRLARTAINHAYWAANMAAAKANPFCRAMHWQLSPSHYERQVTRFGEDICDAYASHDEGLGRGNFPIDDVPMPHAQCLCATWQVVPELSDVADRLGAWVDGGEDAELDAAFGEWKVGKPALTRLDARGTMKLDNSSTATGGRREQILSKIGALPWAQSISEKNRKAILNQLGKLDDDELDFWNRNAYMIQGDFAYQGGTAYYMPSEQKVYLDLSKLGPKESRLKLETNLVTFFHETGHMFDWQAFGYPSLREQIGDLDKTLRADYTAYAKRLLEQKGLGEFHGLSRLTSDQRMALSMDLYDDMHMKSSVSDIVGGLTKNTVQGGWGHSKEYWKYQKPSVEAMAHMFEAKFMKGERLETFKKYFPTAYQKFEDAIKTSEGGGEDGSE